MGDPIKKIQKRKGYYSKIVKLLNLKKNAFPCAFASSTWRLRMSIQNRLGEVAYETPRSRSEEITRVFRTAPKHSVFDHGVWFASDAHRSGFTSYPISLFRNPKSLNGYLDAHPLLYYTCFLLLSEFKRLR